jgi:FkbM family methyltransferase
MNLSTLAYKKCLSARGGQRLFWSVVRKYLIRVLNDPDCLMPIHGRNLHLSLSHALPLYLNNHPFYDRLPGRISEYIHRKYGFIKCIDVGANIGDTIAAFYKDEQDRFLAIEPNKTFYKYLLQNWGGDKNVEMLSCACGADSRTETYEVLEKAGTASLVTSEDGTQIEIRSLDNIVADHKGFADFNILKIDTDGHDFEVIKGAQNIISANLPVILFECEANANNSNYVDDLLGTLNLFSNSGYRHFLLYDNFGYLMGNYSLDHAGDLKRLLFYQLTSNFYYFDICVMTDEDIVPFYSSEIGVFVDAMSDKSLQRTATGPQSYLIEGITQ